jgi:hypothetical protein
MLRLVLGLIALGLLACGAVLWVIGFAGAWVFIVWGAILFLALVYERFRYKTIAPAKPGPGWVKTAERFVDDETGKPVTVYLQPQTGERMYVEE